MIKYGITHINGGGDRQLTFANHGRNLYSDPSECLRALEIYKPQLRSKVLGNRADTLEIRQVDCYENGDAKGLYFD